MKRKQRWSATDWMELSRLVHRRTGVPIRYIRPVLVALGGCVLERLAAGQTVVLPELGTLEVVASGPSRRIRFRAFPRANRAARGNAVDAVVPLRYPPFTPPEAERADPC